MKGESSKEEKTNYSSNVKFMVAACYLIFLIGSSFLPPGYGPRCLENKPFPACFTLQILFQWSWSYYTIHLIKHKNILDLKNEQLENILESNLIIKKDRQKSVKHMKNLVGSEDENNQFFNHIEGLDPPPKIDLLKMIKEQRREYQCKAVAVNTFQTIFFVWGMLWGIIKQSLFENDSKYNFVVCVGDGYQTEMNSLYSSSSTT